RSQASGTAQIRLRHRPAHRVAGRALGRVRLSGIRPLGNLCGNIPRFQRETPGFKCWRRATSVAKGWKGAFYLSLDGKILAVDMTAGSTLEAGAPHVLFQPRFQGDLVVSQYCVTHDGQRFLLAEPVDRTKAEITVVVNWTAGLKR